MHLSSCCLLLLSALALGGPAAATASPSPPGARTSESATRPEAPTRPPVDRGSAASTRDRAVDVANRLLDSLEAQDYDAAYTLFDEGMKAAVSRDQLRAVWESLPAQFGEARSRGAPEGTTQQGMEIVLMRLEFTDGAAIAQIAVAADGRIAGFLIKPAPPPAARAPPADASYTEHDMAIGSGDRALPGTLALPRGKGPFPGVVLVHGSGPQDRHQTLGPNRPFLDLARGLAERGIAVLRYDKRTLVHPEEFAGDDYTVDEETVNDAVEAVAFVRAAKGIDSDQVFVFGHSQGAMLAPRIAQRAPGLAGVVMMAAPARSLLDLLPEQNRHLLELDGSIDEAERQFLADLDAQIARVRNPHPDDAGSGPLSLPLAYWRHFDAIDPVADARKIELPLLLLQGGRDFQVIDTDWSRWRQALSGRRETEFRHYPNLNHLGIPGTGESSAREYQQAGHVAPALIADVAAWILRTKDQTRPEAELRSRARSP